MNFLQKIEFLIVIVCCNIYVSNTFGPFALPVAIGFTSAALYNLRCKLNLVECCTEFGIPANFNKLEYEINDRVYGQKLVNEIVVNAIRAHWQGATEPQKALTMSFHGWPGSGKNYVTKFIIENLYEQKSKSKFVHHFIGRLHFPREQKVVDYQKNLYEWIKTNVTICNKQLFIFDEVDKMPPKVLNIIKPIIDYRDNVEGVDYRKCIFIFLSNTGADLINGHYLDLWKRLGKKREDLTLTDFEKLISMGAFNEEGGFHQSETIKSNLIDHYVPFLPMERQHIKLCILDEFRQRGIKSPSQSDVNEAMDFIEWGPNDDPIFAKTGCKRISQKVGMIAAKNKIIHQ